MNTIFGATFVGRWFEDVFCSLRSHGTRFAYGRLRAQALSQPCLVMGRAKVERLQSLIFATNGEIERFDVSA